MQIVCYSCGKGMGDIDVEPTEEIKVWYGLHDGCEIGMFLQSDWSIFNEHVRTQNELVRKEGPEKS